MKKYIRTITAIFLVLCSGVFTSFLVGFQYSADVLIYGAEDEENANHISKELEELLNKQLSSEDKQMLNDKDAYKDEILYNAIKDNPVIKVYSNVYWEYSDYKLEEIIKKAQNKKTEDFYVFSDKIFRISIWEADGEISISEIDEERETPVFIEDLKSLDGVTTICNKECAMENIICFDGIASHDGIVVYYVTDKGTFVKYYDSYTSQAMTYEEKDFSKYAQEYYKYSTSSKNNYFMDGSPICGDTSFAYYMENREELNADDNILSILLKQNVFWLICGGILLLVVISEVAASAKRRKNKQNQ